MSTRTAGRIVIPASPAELLKLAQSIYDKHKTDGAASPLNAMADFNWAADGPKIAACLSDHEEAQVAAKKAEDAFMSRDLNLKPIRAIVANSASVLKSVYAKNPKKLGDWGITVDDSPKAKVPKAK